MEHTELLLAAAVLELAGKIKAGKSTEYWKSLTDSPDQTQRRERWDEENKAVSFIPEALAQLKAVAEVIRSAES